MIAVTHDFMKIHGCKWAEVYDIPTGDVMKHILVTNAYADLQKNLHDQAMSEAKTKRR